jgi:hypothetical protein
LTFDVYFSDCIYSGVYSDSGLVFDFSGALGVNLCWMTCFHVNIGDRCISLDDAVYCLDLDLDCCTYMNVGSRR